MRKNIETYGIKEIRWIFEQSELESMMRKYLFDKGEIKTSPSDYSLEFDWEENDDTYKISLMVTKRFKQKQSPDNHATQEVGSEDEPSEGSGLGLQKAEEGES